MQSQLPTSDMAQNNLSTENVNTSQGGTGNNIQFKYEIIGGSNNSQIYEVFKQQQQQSQENPNTYMQSTGMVMKTVSHTNTKSHSKLQIHRKECQDMVNEYRLMSQLDHQGILPVYQHFCQDQKQCAMTMPKADCDLFQYLKNQKSRINLSNVRKIFKQTGDALNYLHNEKNIAHNDLKLANYFLFMKKGQMKIADFGFAQLQTSENCPIDQLKRWQTRARQTMSPEMIQKILKQNDTEYISETQSDVFSFGITLFQTVFLRSPFSSDQALPEDILYQHFFSKDYMKFWSDQYLKDALQYYQNEKNSKLSLLLDLITKCLYPNPQERITMQQVVEHPWFQ